ncbi:hypothetical protein [Acidovorax delafieldii]|uniref:hypothetical protein n=1 Tax=Acidovorax delafieldii TaxID=47920 RepID=UPI003B284278
MPTFAGGFGSAGTFLASIDGGTTWFGDTDYPSTRHKVAVPSLEVWSVSVLGLLVAELGVRRMRRRGL